MSSKFIGRAQELEQLEQYFSNDHSNFVVIKGRRRIGKSRLIEEFAKNKDFYQFIGIAPEKNVTAQTQRNDFARRLKRYIADLPNLKADDWSELFELLSKQTQKGKVVILLDEISWMATADPAFLGKLKNAWDEFFKKNNNLMLIACGSISSWLDENLLASTNFVGRIHLVLTLKELSLPECNEFWGRQKDKISAFDKLKYLSVTGGIPLYLENLDKRLPIDDSIKQLCFETGGLLYREFDNIFHDLFDIDTEYYKKIVQSLADGPLSLEEICTKCQLTSGGMLTRYLYDLTETGFIKRDYTWSFKTGLPGKLSKYRLSDNYIRFYIHYIEKHQSQIERDQYKQFSLSSLPEWPTIMGLQLENLVLNNRTEIWKKLHISPQTIVNDGPYFQKGGKNQKGCQIDYLIQTQFNNLFVIEVKCSRNEIKKSIIQEMEEKINNMTKPKNFSAFPILISAGDISDAVYDAHYFSHIIDLREFLN